MLINSSKIQSIGLTAEKIHQMEASEAGETSRQWQNKALMDINMFTKAWGAYQASSDKYDDDQKLHESKRDDNAMPGA